MDIMAFQRGDVVLIPFPYTDLSSKTRPGVIVSSAVYHAARSELLCARYCLLPRRRLCNLTGPSS